MNCVYNLRKRPTIASATTTIKKRRLSKKATAPAKPVCGIQNLPVEIMTSIFELLDLRTRISVEGVCRRWKNIATYQAWRKTTVVNISRFMPCLPRKALCLKSMWLANLKTVKKKFQAIAKRCAPYIKDANFSGIHCSFSFAYCWKFLLKRIPANQLRHFRAFENGINNAQIKKMGRRFRNLKSMDIWGYVADSESLSNFFQTCPFLEHLHLNRSDLTDASFDHLPSSLKSLGIIGCDGIDNSKLVHVVERCPQLESLQLRILVQQWNLDYIFSKLKHLRKLEIVGYSIPQVTSLACMAQLTHLDISCDKWLTDSVLQSIGQLSQLKNLLLYEYLKDHKYSEHGLLHLANLNHLEKLFLGRSRHLTDSILMAIAGSNLQLKSLSIPNSFLISNISILFVLDTCRQLNALSVSGCQHLTNTILEAIVQKLVEKHGPSCPTKTEPEDHFFQLDYYGTKIDGDKVDKNPWLTMIY